MFFISVCEENPPECDGIQGNLGNPHVGFLLASCEPDFPELDRIEEIR